MAGKARIAVIGAGLMGHGIAQVFALAGHDVTWKDQYALTVVMATQGYPGAYGKGSEIRGADAIDSDTLHVFHAGTRRDGERLLANGGRVLNVTALGGDVKEAQDRAYAGVDQIVWPEGFCRRDIGWRELARTTP